MKKLILISMILAFSFTCFAQKGKWKKAQEIDSIESYENFLERYPKSIYANDAIVKLLELEHKRANETSSFDSYSSFLKKYQNYKNADFERARERLISIDYKEAKKKNTIDAYNRFLNLYPFDNFYREYAQSAIDLLDYLAAIKSRTVDGYKLYLKKHPNSKRTHMAKNKILAMEEFSRVKKINTIEAYDQFIKKYPKSTEAIMAKYIIKSKERKMEQQQVEKINTLESRLLFASKYGELDDIKELIVKKVDVNYKDSAGTTALMKACLNGHSDIVNYLILKGADIKMKDNNGYTAMVIAINNGRFKIINDLFAKGYKSTSYRKWNESFLDKELTNPLIIEWSKTGQLPLSTSELNNLKDQSSTKMSFGTISFEGYMTKSSGTQLGFWTMSPDKKYKFSSTYFAEKGAGTSKSGKLTPTTISYSPNTETTYKYEIKNEVGPYGVNFNIIIPCGSIIILDKKTSPIVFCGYVYESGTILVDEEGLILLPGTKIIKQNF
jgi:ankyrin repeat protein